MSDVRDSKNRAWREVAAIDAAYERGEIDDEGWHRAMATPPYRPVWLVTFGVRNAGRARAIGSSR